MTTFGAKQSRGYDQRGYDQRASRLLGRLYRRIAADIDAVERSGAWVLDVGTGPGELLAQLHCLRPDLRLHGIDLSPHMSELADAKLSGGGRTLGW